MKKTKDNCQQKEDIYKNKYQKFSKTMLLLIGALLSCSTLVYKYVSIEYSMAQRVKITRTNEPNMPDGTPKKGLIRGRGGGGDTIDGRSDNSLSGGSGDDVLTGGPSSDHFICGSGADTITDFTSPPPDTRTANC